MFKDQYQEFKDQHDNNIPTQHSCLMPSGFVLEINKHIQHETIHLYVTG